MTTHQRSLTRARRISTVFDTAFRVPGTSFRFGLDPVLGLLPGVGDALGGTFSAYLIWVAARLGAPVPVLMRMVLYVALDALFGVVPLLGDLLDAGWKANVRNLAIIERYVDEPEHTTKSSKGVLIGLLIILALLLAFSMWLAIATFNFLLANLW